MPRDAQTYYAKNRERILAQAKQRNALRRAGLPLPGRTRLSADEVKEYQRKYREAHKQKANAYWRNLPSERKREILDKHKASRLASPAKYLLQGAKTRSDRNGVPFTICLQDVEKILDQGQCECCGKFVETGSHEGSGDRRKGPTADAATLDRVVDSRGYTPENIALLCWTCNRAKGVSTLEQLEQIAAWLRSRQ